MTMIGSFLSSVDSAVCIDMYIIVIGYFKSCTRIMMSSELLNYRSTYCFSFLLNLLYWSLASLYSDLVSKTTSKSSTASLNFRIDDVYAGRSKCLPHMKHHWWTPPYSTTVLDSSYASIGWTWFTSGFMTSGGCCVTVPETGSHDWWGCFSFWSHQFSFLNNVELTLLSLLQVGHNPMHFQVVN